MIKAVIFDMDGLLIDTEHLWQKSQIEAFKACNVALDHQLCRQTMGLRIDEVVDYWYQKFNWDIPSKEEIEDSVIQNVISLIQKEGYEKPGVSYIINYFKSRGLKLAIASSSASQIINVVTNKLQIKDFFEVIHSAENERYGKPHPEVYISAAKMLSVHPSECLVFEDSFNGILAAKSARMHCIAVPDASLAGSHKLSIADDIINSLDEFKDELWVKYNV